MEEENLYQQMRKDGPRYRPNDQESIDKDVIRRKDFVSKWGYVLYGYPHITFIDKFIQHQSVLEIGSGLGLLARLLGDIGTPVIATDDYSDLYDVPKDKFYTNVLKIPAYTAVQRYGTKVLLLSHPPADTEMASGALHLFNGNKVVYIGEPRGGNNATNLFFDILDEDWVNDSDERQKLSQWYGINDSIMMYNRRKR